MSAKNIYDDINFIIIAAGKGTRMNSSYSKVMHKIDEIPLLGILLNKIKNISSLPIFVVASPDAKDLLGFIDSYNNENIKLVFQKEKLGTAHAVIQALDYAKENLITLGKKTIILYGDTPFITIDSIAKIIEKLQNNNAVILGFKLDNDKHKYGCLEFNEKDNLVNIIEYGEPNYFNIINSDSLYNSGIMGFNTTSLLNNIYLINNNNNKKKEYYLTDIVGIITKNNSNKIAAIEVDYQFMRGINTREDLLQVKMDINKKRLYDLMASGVTIMDINNTHIGENVNIARDVVIYPFTYIGNNVTIGEGAIIKSFSHIDGDIGDIVIGEGAIIGPYARIRKDSYIEDDVRIGNFVEIKAAKIQKNTKISHLSYIGDANIGNSVNIGAGTITCNYDGKNKHITNIGSDSFIGSNSIFIAPITVGSNVMTAAGGVFSDDIDSNSLVIARVRQKYLRKNILMKDDNNNEEN